MELGGCLFLACLILAGLTLLGRVGRGEGREGERGTERKEEMKIGR